MVRAFSPFSAAPALRPPGAALLKQVRPANRNAVAHRGLKGPPALLRRRLVFDSLGRTWPSGGKMLFARIPCAGPRFQANAVVQNASARRFVYRPWPRFAQDAPGLPVLKHPPLCVPPAPSPFSAFRGPAPSHREAMPQHTLTLPNAKLKKTSFSQSGPYSGDATALSCMSRASFAPIALLTRSLSHLHGHMAGPNGFGARPLFNTAFPPIGLNRFASRVTNNVYSAFSGDASARHPANQFVTQTGPCWLVFRILFRPAPAHATTKPSANKPLHNPRARFSRFLSESATTTSSSWP
uniref:Uncharacterized protein n=1 Tax=Trypanosoma vivax (strain Y486) TaxID=1055687 RepID=G0TV14_TRYVY|nr:conserved hypothetical protein, in T. vivax [Trypanosoma vivax Y486]